MAAFTETNTGYLQQLDNDNYYLVSLINNNGVIQVVNSTVLPSDFSEEWKAKFFQTSFNEQIHTMLRSCFPDLTSDIQSYLYGEFQYTSHHLLFSHNNLVQCYNHYLMSSGEFDLDILLPQGFCSMILFGDDNGFIKIQKTAGSEWQPSQYYVIYNVCKNDSINKSGICTTMINKVVSDASNNLLPIFLYVRDDNEKAKQCYINNHFQTMIDVFETDETKRLPMKYNETDIFMCHNNYNMQVVKDNKQYQVSPSNRVRIAMVAHGGLSIDPSVMFKEGGFQYKEHEESFTYPFKNLQFFTDLGRGVYMDVDDESSAIYDICYEKIIQTETNEPTNQVLNMIPMVFEGYKPGSDPKSRENFMGLYDCNQKKRIVENKDLFSQTVELEYKNIFKYIHKWCIMNNYNVDNVEVKVFACRSICPTGTFAVRQSGGDENLPIDTENVGVDNNYDTFEASNREDFYKFVSEQQNITCELPSTGGKKKKDIKPTKKRIAKKRNRTIKKRRRHK